MNTVVLIKRVVQNSAPRCSLSRITQTKSDLTSSLLQWTALHMGDTEKYIYLLSINIMHES